MTPFLTFDYQLSGLHICFTFVHQNKFIRKHICALLLALSGSSFKTWPMHWNRLTLTSKPITRKITAIHSIFFGCLPVLSRSLIILVTHIFMHLLCVSVCVCVYGHVHTCVQLIFSFTTVYSVTHRMAMQPKFSRTLSAYTLWGNKTSQISQCSCKRPAF